MEKDFLYKVSEKLYDSGIWKKKSSLLCPTKVKQNIGTLYPGDAQNRIRQHVIQKIRKCLLVFMAGIFLSLLVLADGYANREIKENRIGRADYGEKSKEVPMVAEIGEEKQEIVLSVEERQYTRDELEEQLSSLLTDLEDQIKGDNLDLEHVKTDLNLMTSFPEYPFQAAWECQDYSLIDSDGTVKNEEVPEEGQVTGINVVFTYKEFRAEHLFYIHIFPPDQADEDRILERLQAAVDEADYQTRYDPEMVLPAKMDDTEIIWKEKKDSNWIYLLVLTVLVSIVLYFVQDQDINQKMEKRDIQMKQDYTELVSKLSIYLGAGMSARQSWEKIVNDYEKNKKNEKEKHYLYEEMGIACQEMKSGISEVSAYDHFGKRCRLQIYLKFSTLLVQNLRKGTTSLGKILKEESRIAFEDRKNEARKRGEEAGTKMLIPMMLMLCMVMIMIMVPAFLTF